MNKSLIGSAIILAACLFAAGCTTPVPVVARNISCEADARLLASNCPKPRELPPDATFQTLVDTMLEDRKALTECGSSVQALVQSLNACKKAVDEFNKEVDTLNNKK
jgi:hypothetical protein